MNIPFFDYPGLYAEHRNEYLAVIDDALSRGAFIMQSDLEAFEEELAQYLGVRHAFGVADGTVALTIALKLAGVGPGHEVVVCSHTFVATAAAVHHCGATPVVGDCGEDHLMDPESARGLVSDRTRAIMPTQLNGRTCNMDRLQAVADDHGLAIVEDSCQALGSRFKGRAAGTFGVAGSFSFFPAKTLGCFGDGGGLVVDDEEAAVRVREMRDHGRTADGTVRRFGHNARLDNVQAAILRVKLARYQQMIARRREIAAHYHERLSAIEGLRLPPPPVEGGDHYDIFQNYEVSADRRDDLRAHLADRGVGTIIQWGGKMVHQLDLDLRAEAPFAEELSRRYLLLPMHHLLRDAQVQYIADQIEAFYQ